MFQKDKIIILRTIKHGEADLVIHGLSSQGARINFFAKSALKSRKRFGGGVLEPTHYVEVTYRQKSGGDGEALHYLQEAQLIEDFHSLRANYEKLELALYFVRVVAYVSQEDLESKETFDLLGNALKALASSSRLDLLRTQFEIKLLYTQGVLPSEVPNQETLLKHSLRDHEKIEIGKKDLDLLRSRVHLTLNQYLGKEL